MIDPLSSAQTIAIIGSGEVGLNIYNALKKGRYGKKTINLFDSNPKRTGLLIENNKVKHTGLLSEFDPDLIILGYNADTRIYKKHKNTLQRSSDALLLSAVELFISLPEMRVWPLLRPKIAIKKEDLASTIINRLSDIESKKQFEQYYSWVCDPKGLFPPEGATRNQYFEQGLITLGTNEVFVDCGAFIGDTLDAFLNRTSNMFGEYYAFEPDKENFFRLIECLRDKDKLTKQKIIPINAAVSGRNGYIEFSDNANQMSQKTVSNGNWVRAYSLGKFNFRKAPTFLKLDLEGAELGALKSCMSNIVKWRPKICVAIYHNPSDFLDIPITLMSSLENYRYYVRAHNKFGLDFVLYCVPT
jgi:FkbM family methyltransferase